MVNNAFLTGSYAYGTPNEKSDIDIATLMDNQLALAVKDIYYNGVFDGWADRHESDNGDVSLKSGKFNLLIFTDETKFNAWKIATNNLIKRKPVTRKEAVEEIDRVYAEMREVPTVVPF